MKDVIDLTVERKATVIPIKKPRLANTLVKRTKNGRINRCHAITHPLSAALAQFKGGRRGAFAILRLSSDPLAVQVIEAWDRLALRAQNSLSMEEFVKIAEISPEDLIGLIYKTAYKFSVQLGHAKAATAYPQIMQASIDKALEADGTAERKMHFEHTGFVPQRGPVVQVQQNTQINNDPGEAPSVAVTARRIIRDLPADV